MQGSVKAAEVSLNLGEYKIKIAETSDLEKANRNGNLNRKTLFLFYQIHATFWAFAWFVTYNFWVHGAGVCHSHIAFLFS